MDDKNKTYIGNGFDKGNFIKVSINVSKLKLKGNYATFILAKRDIEGELGESHNAFYYNERKK